MTSEQPNIRHALFLALNQRQPELPLKVRVEPLDERAGPIPDAPELADRHIEMNGRCEDQDGYRKLTFRMAVYRHRSGELEAWLSDAHLTWDSFDVAPRMLRWIFEELGRHGVRRVRTTAGDVCPSDNFAWILAQVGFAIDPDRAPGFGADGRGIGRGGDIVASYADDPTRALMIELIKAAVLDHRIELGEAVQLYLLVTERGLESPAQIAAAVEPVLALEPFKHTRWPGVYEIG